jgi:glycosyltransferase involved in cell wall biosynthesis
MKNSDTLVLFSNYENLPCVIVEALACGLSIISTNVGGISEHITSERGILVAPADETALSEALLSMAETHTQYSATSQRAYAIQHFSKQSIAEQFHAIYLSAMND